MTYMQEEILQTADVLLRLYQKNLKTFCTVADSINAKGIKNIIVAARGSSHNAGFILKNLVEKNCAGLLVSFELPSLATHYGAARDLSKTLYVIVSQSGASVDTLKMLSAAKASGAVVVAVTNNPQSECAKNADFHIELCAGEERAVAATKTFTSEMFAMILLSRAICGDLEKYDIENLKRGMKEVLERQFPAVPDALKKSRAAMVLSRATTECVAKECALKLMECCYKFVYAGTINEFHHGPKALLETDIPVILIAPEASDGFSLASDYINAAKFLKSLKVCLISLTDIDEVAALSDLSFRLPKAADGNEAVFSALAVQKLVLALALSLELNPDAPRNLKKITITK